MLIKHLNRDEAEEIFVTVQNAAGETLSNGVFLCWSWLNAASHGNAVVKPTTSGLGLFAGVLAHKQPSYADLPSNSYGLLQVYGVHGSVAHNIAGTSVSCAGQWLIPTNALYSGQYDGNLLTGLGLEFATQCHIVARGAFLMTNDLSGPGRAEAFVRAI